MRPNEKDFYLYKKRKLLEERRNRIVKVIENFCDENKNKK